MNILGNKKLSRRLLLRGSAASIALPIFDAALNENGTAFADGAGLPCRLGVFFWGNGVRPDRWKPSGSGENWQLSEELMPLANVKDSISVLSGMDMMFDGTAHHRGRAGMLCGAYDKDAGNYGQVAGPSFDQIAAEHFDGQTRFRSLELGISMRAKGGVNARQASGSTSWSGPNKRVPAEFSPAALFDRIFANQFDQQDESARHRHAMRQSILDSVKADADNLKLRLGQTDTQRLNAHLESIRQLERSIGEGGLACSKPEIGSDPDVDLGHELLEERNQLMADILARALACDATRVFSYEYMGMQADTIFWQVGATEGSHVMTHDDRNLPEKLDPQFENVHQVVVFVMGQFAYLLQSLKEISEGPGTLLDNCAILATSEVNDGTKHNYDDMPIVVAGRAGGSLRSNLHYVAEHENSSKVPLTLLRATGVPATEFGQDVGRVEDSVAALLA